MGQLKSLAKPELLKQARLALETRLPPGWTVVSLAAPATGIDAVWQVRAPDGTTSPIAVEAKSALAPRDVPKTVATLSKYQTGAQLVAAPFLSRSARERLCEAGTGYVDLTGNTRLVVPLPGLFIETEGADKDPNPSGGPRRSLKGAKARRLVRALCDYRQPLAVGELAKRAGIDTGYASRLIEFLSREDLITRVPRGPVLRVAWNQLLRRWARDYAVLTTNVAAGYIASRGIQPLVDGLKHLTLRYAATGSLAANRVSPVAPTRLVMCYVDDPAEAAGQLGLTSTDIGGNVILLRPDDDIVFERTKTTDGINCAALSQVVVDLLTSPGRGPAEGEALMDWMAKDENAWRC